MKNLSGIPNADETIDLELREAGIPVYSVPAVDTEVPYSLIGKTPCRRGSEEFTFTRAWYYWVVKGPVPFSVAKELFSTAVGKRYIRVNGDAGVTDPRVAPGAKYGVYTYHIDSQEALNYFVKVLRKHKII